MATPRPVAGTGPDKPVPGEPPEPVVPGAVGPFTRFINSAEVIERETFFVLNVPLRLGRGRTTIDVPLLTVRRQKAELLSAMEQAFAQRGPLKVWVGPGIGITNDGRRTAQAVKIVRPVPPP
jgi:hypothetical protein